MYNPSSDSHRRYVSEPNDAPQVEPLPLPMVITMVSGSGDECGGAGHFSTPFRGPKTGALVLWCPCVR